MPHLFPCEALEKRYALAVSASFADSRLDILGDNFANTILVSTTSVDGIAKVTVKGLQVGSGVDASAVTSIVANLGGGADTMSLSTLDLMAFSGLADRSITINGGPGNDRIIGSSLADVLRGDGGDDDIRGRGGDDELDGGSGADTLYGQGGADTIFGRVGDDLIYGGAGPDDLRGGAGSDQIHGEDGRDILRGGEGADSLYGSDGNDRLAGGNGDDLMAGGSGDDGYVFPNPEHTGLDTIDELTDGGTDRINVEKLDLTSPLSLDSTEPQALTAGQSLRFVNAGTVETITNEPTIRPSEQGVYTVPGGAEATTPVTFRYGGGNTTITTTLYFYEVDDEGYPIHSLYPDEPLIPRGQLIGEANRPIFLEHFYAGGTRLAFFIERDDGTGGTTRFYSMPTMNADGEHARISADAATGEMVFSWEDTPQTLSTSTDPDYADFDDVILAIGSLITNKFAPVIWVNAGEKSVNEDGSESLTFTFTNMEYDGVNPPVPWAAPTAMIVPFSEAPYSTARAGLDYSGLPGNLGMHVVVIPAGSTSTSLTLTLINDTEVEADEKIDFSPLTMFSHDWLGRPNSTFTTIFDDDKIDLDVDSDNSGEVNRTANEEAKEQDTSEPGKLLAVGGPRQKVVIEFKGNVSPDLSIVSGAEHIKLWTQASGGTEIVFTRSEPDGTPVVPARSLPGDDGSTTKTIWIEAVSGSAAAGDIVLMLKASDGGESALNVDIVRATAFAVDLDIDSDNNNEFGTPEGSQWEDDLEVEPYGLGKLIMLDNPDRPLTPVLLELPRGLPLDYSSLDVLVDWTPTGRAGEIKLWTTYYIDALRNPAPADEGGDRVYPGASYTLDELGYDPGSGLIALYAEGVTENEEIKTLAGVERAGKPDERIRTTVRLNGNAFGFDEVKYLVANEDSFFYQLQTRREVRNELASYAVYRADHLADMPDFSLKKLSPADLQRLGVPDEVNLKIGDGSGLVGFKSLVYQDYITGQDQYVVSFAGTDDTAREFWNQVLLAPVALFSPDVQGDWRNNVSQGLGFGGAQYTYAMEIGFGLSRRSEIPGGHLIATGHSLGGGLANAAAVVGEIPADTFNSAWLRQETLLEPDGMGGQREIYPGSLARFANTASFIDAYYVDWDVLTFAQSLVSGDRNFQSIYPSYTLPVEVALRLSGLADLFVGFKPTGTMHLLDGPRDAELAWSVSLLSVLEIIFSDPEWEDIPVVGPILMMVDLHSHPSIAYGLLVTEDSFGNHVTDMLGYSAYFGDGPGAESP